MTTRMLRQTALALLIAAAAAFNLAPRSATAAAAAAAPDRGGILVYFNRIDPPGFDLHRFLSHPPLFVAQVFNNLVRFDNNKDSLSPSNIVPDLAERWEVSNNGQTYTFHLRKGVKWHDGKPFSAADVKYSLEKMADPKRSAISGTFGSFERVEVVDPNTVRVHLKYAQASYISMLASVYAVMQPAHNAAADGRAVEHLVGTGPFRFKERKAGVSFELQRNADYFKPGLPYLDGIRILIIPDEQASMAAFVGKRVHMSHPSTAWRNDEVLETIRTRAAGATTVIKGSPRANTLWLNVKTVPDPRVRKALALVVSAEEVVVAAYGAPRWGSAGYGIFPYPWTIGPDAVKKELGWDKPQQERIAEARRLLKEASAQNVKLRLLARTGVPETERVLAYLADIWRRHLNVSSDIMIRELAEVVRIRDAGQFDVFLDSPYATLGDPDEFSSYFVSGGRNNFSGYSNPAVDKLFAQQSRARELPERTALAQQIERAILADTPIIPSGLFQKFGVSWWPVVQNYTTHPTPFSTNMQMEQVWLKRSEDWMK